MDEFTLVLRDLEMMNLQVGASVLGLVATGCDIAFTWRGEVQYIWRKPLRVTFVRCIFTLMRYLPIATHVIDVTFASLWIDGTERVHEEHCKSILIFRTLASSGMLLLLDLILMLRVFALYDRSRLIGTFLLCLLASRIVSIAYTSQDHLLRSPEKLKFTSYCIPQVSFKDAPGNPILVFIYGELIIQSVIIALAMKRTVWDLRRYSYSLFSVLNRDGLVVFCTVGVTMVVIGVASVKNGAATVFVFPLFISLISAAGCHTVLNLQKLESAGPSANSSERKKDLELTTIDNGNILTWNAPWDTRTFQIIDHDTTTGAQQGAGTSSSNGVPVYTVDRTCLY
ncbi:hypothetical protein BDP27DRAFT_1451465 [Rhodocollybia butyracea]|uniref:DUF6533 domain-containing protein n=1 Tax=Rhodocollybia butyracea TaxID=206335 RepID=A0A9P5PGS1_9AGAR|nr:hypothetical protein BDP27DRAFT_1451465 [Rhodocollybia butyracea]